MPHVRWCGVVGGGVVFLLVVWCCGVVVLLCVVVPHVPELEPHHASRRDTRRSLSHFGALGRRDTHATARGMARNMRAHDTQRIVASRAGCVTRHGMVNAFDRGNSTKIPSPRMGPAERPTDPGRRN